MMNIMLSRLVMSSATLAMVLLAAACRNLDVNVRIPREMIQKQVEAQFPIERRDGLLFVRFANPGVDLDGERDRIVFRASMEVSALGLWNAPGMVSVDAGLSYEPPEGAFYARDAVIRELELGGLGSEALQQVRTLASTLLKSRLEKIPLYRLNPRDTKENLARLLLRSVRIEDRSVVVTLGLQ